MGAAELGSWAVVGRWLEVVGGEVGCNAELVTLTGAPHVPVQMGLQTALS